MSLDTNQRKQAIYFTGIEVEHTVCYGMKTLFVVGLQPTDKILELAEKNQVEQIYFGTSQSFPKIDINDFTTWSEWSLMIENCLMSGYWCTLDLDVQQAAGLLDTGLCEYNRFVPMISVKLPYISQFNYNTTIKLDDVTWGATNSGVWTHHLHSLLTKENYTHWDQYIGDTSINGDTNE
jgi:hypothetical protein